LTGTGGFTLIELVFVMLILGIIAAVVSQFALQGIRSYSIEQDRGDAHSQARLAVERVVREARAIRSCADIADPSLTPSATLSFTDSSGTAVTFNVDAARNLTRDGNILARGVSSTSLQPFRFLKKDGVTPTTSCASPDDIWFIEITLTCAQGSESLRLRNQIHPRNF